MRRTLRRSGSGCWIQIEKYIKEELEDSKHELVRGNVVTATRIFHQRVKAFISKIVMCKSNPLSVKFYTYKVEFQERGAGHIHGTLWLDTKRLEMLQVVNGSLQVSSDESSKGPMQGLTQAFIKLRTDKKLNDNDKSALINFIDSFTTVSLHKLTVGEDVAEIVKEVNQHHHTKSCGKYSTKCRFNYPKPPTPFTIIAKPAQELKNKSNLAKNQLIIKMVMEVAEDKKVIEEIMDHHKKDNESAENHLEGIERRVKMLCQKAKVNYNEYLEALGTSNNGYSVVLKSVGVVAIGTLGTWALPDKERNLSIRNQKVLKY